MAKHSGVAFGSRSAAGVRRASGRRAGIAAQWLATPGAEVHDPIGKHAVVANAAELVGAAAAAIAEPAQHPRAQGRGVEAMAARWTDAEVQHDRLPFSPVWTDPGAMSRVGDDVRDLVRDSLTDEVGRMSMQKRRVVSYECPAREREPGLAGSQPVQIETDFGWRHRQVEPRLRLTEKGSGPSHDLLHLHPKVCRVGHRRWFGSCLRIGPSPGCSAGPGVFRLSVRVAARLPEVGPV